MRCSLPFLALWSKDGRNGRTELIRLFTAVWQMVTRRNRPQRTDHGRRSHKSRRAVFLLLALALVATGVVVLYVGRRPDSQRSSENLDSTLGQLRLERSISLPLAPAPLSVQQLREEFDAVVQELMQRYPESPGALHIAARQYAELQQYAKAAEIWERCIQLAPTYAGPRIGLAIAAMERGDDVESIEILEQALAAGCRTRDIFDYLASALQKLGRLDEAEAVLRQGLEAFAQDPDLWISLGQIQFQLEKLDDAQKSLREAIRLRPDSTTAHFALANVSARLGQDEEAAEHRRRFTELKSKHPLMEQRFQIVYESVLRRIGVITLCDSASEYQRQGAPRDAERLYYRALELNPNNADTCRWLASFYRSQGRIGDAHQLQGQLVKLEPGRVENYVNLASLSAQLGRQDAAESSLLTAIQIAPHAAIAYHSLAGHYLQRGQSNQARQYAEEAARLEPSVEAYLLVAAACEQLGDLGAAGTALRSARRLAPDDPRVQRVAP